jgi:threonine dehydrogenase-like Zn-dependent dehydrogenase
MKTLALRLYGKNDLRLEEFDLPEMKDDEILASIETDSICMSTYKATIQGPDHQKVPKDVDKNPIIVGHEFSGTLLEIGRKYKDKFKPGQKYSIQPAINYPGRGPDAPGYSFQYVGGDATKVIIPKEVLEMDCLLPYDGEGFFKASLSEPVSCIIGAFKAQIHMQRGVYTPKMGIVEGGAMAIIAGAGPMGMGAIDYAIHGPKKPKLLVVTDIDNTRLSRAASLLSPAEAKTNGVDLRYVNTGSGNPVQDLMDINGGKGYDDVYVFAPVAPLVEQASRILGFAGCINFFAGPSKQEFFAPINFYHVHYSLHTVAGTSGGNTDDLREALDLMGKGLLNPACMITHVGGIDSAAATIKNLPNIPGGKKLIYTTKSMPMTALDDFAGLGKHDPFFEKLAQITKENNGLWSVEAEKYLMEHATQINV